MKIVENAKTLTTVANAVDDMVGWTFNFGNTDKKEEEED